MNDDTFLWVTCLDWGRGRFFYLAPPLAVQGKEKVDERCAVVKAVRALPGKSIAGVLTSDNARERPLGVVSNRCELSDMLRAAKVTINDAGNWQGRAACAADGESAGASFAFGVLTPHEREFSRCDRTYSPKQR